MLSTDLFLETQSCDNNTSTNGVTKVTKVTGVPPSLLGDQPVGQHVTSLQYLEIERRAATDVRLIIIIHYSWIWEVIVSSGNTSNRGK